MKVDKAKKVCQNCSIIERCGLCLPQREMAVHSIARYNQAYASIYLYNLYILKVCDKKVLLII